MKSRFFSIVVIGLACFGACDAWAQMTQPPESTGHLPSSAKISAPPSSPGTARANSKQGKAIAGQPLQAESTYSTGKTNRTSDSAALRMRRDYDPGLLGALARPRSRSFLHLFDITAPYSPREKVRGGQPWTGSYGGTSPTSPISTYAEWGELEGINILTISW